jgi:hypothetical protein
VAVVWKAPYSISRKDGESVRPRKISSRMLMAFSKDDYVDAVILRTN